MIFFKLNVPKFVKEFLGRKFFKAVHFTWLISLLKPLEDEMSAYDVWRKERFYIINITGQIISLTGYLNDKFDPVLRRIYIITSNDYYSGIWVALESESEPFVWASLESEGVDLWVGLESEVNAGDDFIVFIPSDIVGLSDQIIAAVHQFKLAGKTFHLEVY